MALLITGAQGQLGRELVARLPEAFATDCAELDITDADAVNRFVRDHRIETIINCAAYTHVDAAETETDCAFAVNAAGPRILAESGCRLIHISTDYVFDGLSDRPYRPEDTTAPLSVYGLSKRLGEEAVLKHAAMFAVIRTSWLYSAHGKNFVKTIRSLAESRREISVVADQVGSPTFAGDLADAIAAVLPKLTPETSGIYHYANRGVCSRHTFAREILRLLSLPATVRPITSDAYPTAACRPRYSALDSSGIQEVFGLSIPDWRESLSAFLAAETF